MADGTGIALYKIRETSQGVLPSNPVFKAVRRTDGGPTIADETATSAELRPDRQPGYTRKTKRTVSGDLVAELTYGTDTDDLLEEAYCGTWTAKSTQTASTISSAAADNSLNDTGNGFVTSGVEAGDKIDISGAISKTGATVVSVVAGKIIVSGVTLADVSAGTSVTITNQTKRLKVGTTRRSSAWVRDQTDITTGRYQVFLATQIDKFALAVEPNGFTKATYTLTGGKQDSVGDSAPTGATFGTLSTTKPVNAIEGTFKVDGTAVGNISKFDMTLENSIEQKDVIHSDHQYYTTDAASVKIGTIKVTGTITVPYDDAFNTYVTKLQAGTEIATAERCQDVIGNAYVFNVPKAMLTAAPTPYGTGAITSDMTYSANYDPVTGCAAYIDKIPA